MNDQERSGRNTDAPTPLADEELENVNGGLSLGFLGSVQSLVARFGLGKDDGSDDPLAALENLTMNELMAIRPGDPRYNAAGELIRRRKSFAGESVSL